MIHDSSDHTSQVASAAEIADLLATLAAISPAELPDGAPRNALAAAIRRGAVDALYRPFGCAWHTIAWADRPAWQDPRQRVSDFFAAHGGQG